MEVREVEAFPEKSPWSIRVYNPRGDVVRTYTGYLPETLNLAGLQIGMYVVTGQNGDHTEHHRIIVR